MNRRCRSALLAVAALLVPQAAPRAGETAPPPAAAGGTFFERASDAASRGEWGAVESIAREWERASAFDPTPPVVQAQALGQLGRFADQAAAARRSLALGETSVARFYLGVALARLGELAAAEEALARAVALAPKDGNARRSWAAALASLGRYAQAASTMERARALLPPDFEVDDQLEYWRLAAGWRFPLAAMAHHGRAGWLLDRERWKEAAEEYSAALRLAPGFVDCRYHLGWALRQMGDDAGAERELRAAIAGYGEKERTFAADARYNLAQLLVDRYRPGEAVPLLRAAIALRGERFWLLDALARACRADGDAGCAREAWEKVVASHEKLPGGLLDEVRWALAELGGALEKPEEKALRTGAAVPVSASHRCDYGVKLGEQGRPGDALREFEAALGEAPDFGFCRLNYSSALVKAGDLGGAERQARLALASKAASADDPAEERRWRAQARFQLAHLLVVRMASPKEAIELTRAAAAVLGESPHMALVLGAACDAVGDRRCAIGALERALQGRARLSSANAATAEKRLRELRAAK